MDVRWRDAVAVIGCLPMATGVPNIVQYLMTEAGHLHEAFTDHVTPLIEQAGLPPYQQHLTHDSLLGTTIKVGLALHGYAHMARLAFRPALVALGSSFTRIYDDAIDHHGGRELDTRLGQLFAGGDFAPHTPIERLLHALYRAIEAALDRPPADPIFVLMAQLHTFQLQSRAQLDSATTTSEIRRITRGKGGLGLTALCALLRTEMTMAEREVLMEFGDILQLLDDHHDVPLDRGNHVHTCATRRDSTISRLAQRIRHLRKTFRRHYGNGRDRQLATMLLMMLAGAAWQQNKDTASPPSTHKSRVALLFGRAGNVTAERGRAARRDCQ